MNSQFDIILTKKRLLIKKSKKYIVCIIVTCLTIVILFLLACLPIINYKTDPLFWLSKSSFDAKAALTDRQDTSAEHLQKVLVTDQNGAQVFNLDNDLKIDEVNSFVKGKVTNLLDSNSNLIEYNSDNLLNYCALNAILDHLAGADFAQSMSAANTFANKYSGKNNCFNKANWEGLISKIYDINYYSTSNLNLQRCSRIYLSNLGFSNSQVDEIQQIAKGLGNGQ